MKKFLYGSRLLNALSEEENVATSCMDELVCDSFTNISIKANMRVPLGTFQRDVENRLWDNYIASKLLCIDNSCHLALKLDHDENYAFHAMPALTSSTGLFHSAQGPGRTKLSTVAVVALISAVIWFLMTSCFRSKDRLSCVANFVFYLVIFTSFDGLLNSFFT